MKNFQCLSVNNHVSTLYNAVIRQPGLWNQNTLRTGHKGTAHSEVSDIWLRFNDVNDDVVDDHESVNYPAYWALPEARPLIFGLMAMVNGERLGRVLIARLPPGGKIYPHVDGGSHAEYYDRYHIVLNSSPGCNFRAGDETVHMQTGDLWWFDNSQEHEVINNGRDDRVHLIVDIRTPK